MYFYASIRLNVYAVHVCARIIPFFSLTVFKLKVAFQPEGEALEVPNVDFGYLCVVEKQYILLFCLTYES